MEMEMEQKMSVVDVMRIRHMKGQPLLQVGDSFNAEEVLEGLRIVNEEAKQRGLLPPVAVRQPN
jgi:hypothetical protein